jgi:phage portal protein BeeE
MGRRYWFLSTSREALWARVQASDFLTVNEKRPAVGYGAIEDGDALTPQPPHG